MLKVTQNMIIQATTKHSYNELKVIMLFDKKESHIFEPMRWLPHTFNNDFTQRYMASEIFGASNIIKNFKIPLKKVAIELNEEIVDKKKLNKISLKKNDKIEIVHFIGGG